MLVWRYLALLFDTEHNYPASRGPSEWLCTLIYKMSAPRRRSSLPTRENCASDAISPLPGQLLFASKAVNSVPDWPPDPSPCRGGVFPPGENHFPLDFTVRSCNN